MKLLLIRTDEPGPPSDSPGGLPATAWTDMHGSIWVRVPYDSKLFARRRIAHEVEHNITGYGNLALHCPWWHCCTAVGHAIRLWDGHVSKGAFKLADKLLRDGQVNTG